MAFTYSPPFSQTPKVGIVVLTAAVTARDGSSAPSLIDTVGSDGAYIKRITFIASPATAGAGSAKVAMVWISIDGGSTYRLKGELAMPTATNSVTAIGQIVVFTFPDGWVVPASAKIYASITVRASAVDDTTVMMEYSNY